MIKVLSQMLCCAALVASGAPFATEAEYEAPAIVELAKGVCADPNMTDEERAEMIEESTDRAVECMGEAWVYGTDDDAKYQSSALGTLDIDADVSLRRIRVTDRNGETRVHLTSPGLPGKTETATGEYFGPFRVEDGNYTVQNPNVDFFGAPMPWATFYKHKTGYAIHGTDATGKLGRPASHGCLRVLTRVAKFINSQVRLANDQSVRINVHGKVAGSRPQPRAPQRPAPRRPSYPIEDGPFPL